GPGGIPRPRPLGQHERGRQDQRPHLVGGGEHVGAAEGAQAGGDHRPKALAELVDQVEDPALVATGQGGHQLADTVTVGSGRGHAGLTEVGEASSSSSGDPLTSFSAVIRSPAGRSGTSWWCGPGRRGAPTGSGCRTAGRGGGPARTPPARRAPCGAG